MEKQRTYIAIDLKSFYASVECRELGRDPLTTNLVVADQSRTNKTICLAVSPSLKFYGISGRARLFEVVSAVKKINRDRLRCAPGQSFRGKSDSAPELEADPSLELDYIVAVPRMALYMEYSTKIYHIYLKYIAPEDIHVYSIDEVLMDVTDYLRIYQMSARQLAMKMAGDGEGATRLIQMRVYGADTKENARVLARSVVSSSLVKAMVFGKDANCGRILCALGYAGPDFDPSRLDLFLEGPEENLCFCKDGCVLDFDEEKALALLSGDAVCFACDMKMGSEEATAWGCDLTYDYVRINGDYRS